MRIESFFNVKLSGYGLVQVYVKYHHACSFIQNWSRLWGSSWVSLFFMSS